MRPIGKLLATHPDIDKIAITGSTNTGRQIIKDSADTFKHVTVELGGKSPDIIFADADLNKAVEAAVSGLYFNKGEICYAGSRLLVGEPVYDKVVSILVEKIKKINAGNPLDPRTDMGPVADKEGYDKILRYIEIREKEDRAALAAGGKPLNKDGGKGYYIEPTLFTNANNQMRIAREEIFGPVLVVIPFNGFEEAMAIANDTPFGLASGVHTSDAKKALKAARILKAGAVWVNTYAQFDLSAPFGGYKAGIRKAVGMGIIRELFTDKDRLGKYLLNYRVSTMMKLIFLDPAFSFRARNWSIKWTIFSII